MRLIRCVDPTPPHWLSDFVLKPLRVRPGFSIDRGQRLPRTKAGALGHHLQYEDFVVSLCSRRVDYQCAGQLRIDTMAQFDIFDFRRTPIEVQTWRCRFESDLLDCSRRYIHSRIATGGVAQTMHRDCYGEGVVQGDMNLGALRHTDKRAGILQRMSSLTERIHRELDTVVRFRMPFALCYLKTNRQDAIAKDGLCRRSSSIDKARPAAVPKSFSA